MTVMFKHIVHFVFDNMDDPTYPSVEDLSHWCSANFGEEVSSRSDAWHEVTIGTNWQVLRHVIYHGKQYLCWVGFDNEDLAEKFREAFIEYVRV